MSRGTRRRTGAVGLLLFGGLAGGVWLASSPPPSLEEQPARAVSPAEPEPSLRAEEWLATMGYWMPYEEELQPPMPWKVERDADGNPIPPPPISGMILTEEDPLSTFSVDVDTASYAMARRDLDEGRLPAPRFVRVEEFLNAVDYDYAQPQGEAPFSVSMEAAPSPWVSGRHVLRIGLQGRALPQAERRPARLTFLVDASGSMADPDKLPLAQRALRDLVPNLDEEDTVSIVSYAGKTEVILAPTPASRTEEIFAAIDALSAWGRTDMGAGLELAYHMAAGGYVDGAENRVIILSDGDANIGATSSEELLEKIGGDITLSVVGFGTGDYRDTLMEQLADKGDGSYFYVDSFMEARRVFGINLAGTIQTIARDVKIQVAFDPAAVSAYRLIGYENRALADVDFRDDEADAGEIGSGHQVTALYELILREGYDEQDALATVRLRAKPPGPDAPAREWRTIFSGSHIKATVADTSASFRLALGAATFAEKLRLSPHVEEISYVQILALLRGIETAELKELIQEAESLSSTVARR